MRWFADIKIEKSMAISFQNISNSAGITYRGESYGTAWGDYDSDGLPDLWVTNHLSRAILYRNQGNGSFSIVTNQAFGGADIVNQDLHGPSWADFDNDGDLDLLQERASDNARGVNILFVNENGTLTDRASAVGISIPTKGRTPLWFDFDRDGLLDMLLNGGARTEAPPTIFRQRTNGTFENANALTGFNLNNSDFAQLSDFTGDGIPELIVDGKTIYNTRNVPFNNITNSFAGNLIENGIEDAAIGDFNGDLRPDLFLTNKGIESDLYQDSDRSFNAFFRGERDEKGAIFTTTGNVTFELATKANFLSVNQIKIGSGGFSPNNFNFTLDPSDPNVQGIAPHNPGVDTGVFIGYDPNSQQWQILWSRSDSRPTYAFVDSTTQISTLDAIGFDPLDQFKTDQLLINTGSQFVDRSQSSGIADIATAGQRVVSGDFDNDMDLDLYVLNTTYAGNRDNILYDNQGNGTFVRINDAGGATGTNLGLGDSVTTVDYDGDGFLDIFATNGNFFAGLGTVSRRFYNDAPYELFRNQGNGNNWLQVELEGVSSNRDGIGASVLATAGGVTQLREQNGGMHKHNQDFQRLHFGLKNNTQVSVLEVKWSSGIVQNLRNIGVNQIITVVEGVGFDGNDRLDGTRSNDRLVGNGGNDRLDGNAGNDTLEGGSGSDRLFGGGGDDFLEGGDGYDNIRGGSGNDRIFGNADNDLLQGQGGSDEIEGGNGNDLINGNGGNDVLQGQGGNDTINGGSGRDLIFGNAAEDLLLGQGGNDTLDGNADNDIIAGGDGQDVIVGNLGNDITTGQAGRDRFRFLTSADGVDEIVDFSIAEDTIELVASGFGGGLSLGRLPNSSFVTGTTAQDSGDRILYDRNTGNLFYDPDGTGSNNSVQLAVLSNQADLNANNIVVI